MESHDLSQAEDSQRLVLGTIHQCLENNNVLTSFGSMQTLQTFCTSIHLS